MAESDNDQDESQKTEDPTQHRLDEAFKKGQVAFSREILHWFMLGTGALIFACILPTTFSWLNALCLPFIMAPEQLTITPALFDHILFGLLKSLGFPLALLVCAALLGGFLQTQLAIQWNSLMPKAERISLTKGFKRLFSQKAMVEFLKGLFKLGVIGVALAFLLRPRILDLVNDIGASLQTFFAKIQSLVTLIFITSLSILGVIAGLDFLYQRFAMRKSLRMTPDEVKKEIKDTQGDPFIKQRFRQIRYERLRRHMMAAVPEASAVITNPTHYSVAIKYDMETMNAPIVVAKGADLVALKIREVAKENKVPIIENPPLARALYSQVDIEQEIPPEHYKAVAEVITFVMNLKKRLF